MAITLHSFNDITYASRTNTVVPAPATISDKDVLFLFFAIGANPTAPTPTPPTGFTVVSGFPLTATDGTGFNLKTYAWTKTAASESGSYTITHTAASTEAYLGAYSGANTTTPFSPAPSTDGGTGTTTTFLTVTTPSANCMVIAAAHDWADTGNTLTAPTGTTPTFTKIWQGTLIFVAQGILAAAGATGAKTMTNNSYSSDPWSSGLFSMQPAVNPPPVRVVNQAVRRAANW